MQETSRTRSQDALSTLKIQGERIMKRTRRRTGKTKRNTREIIINNYEKTKKKERGGRRRRRKR